MRTMGYVARDFSWSFSTTDFKKSLQSAVNSSFCLEEARLLFTSCFSQAKPTLTLSNCRMDVFKIVESKKDAWTHRNLSNIDLVIHGEDYLDKLAEVCPSFRGYGPEYLEAAKNVLDEVIGMSQYGIRPTFIFVNWSQSPTSDGEKRRTKVLQLAHMIKDNHNQNLLECIWDPDISTLPHLNRVFLELLCWIPGVRFLSCDSHLNRTVVSYAAAKNFAFMASSVECGIFQAQMEKPIIFWQIRSFVSRYKTLLSALFRPEKFHSFCLESECLPILAWLSTNRNNPEFQDHLPSIPRSPADDVTEEEQWHSDFGTWLQETGYTRSLIHILSPYTADDLARKGKLLFSGIANYTIQSFDPEKNQFGFHVLRKTESQMPPVENKEDLTEMKNFPYDWYMILSMFYFLEDPVAFTKEIWDDKLTFISNMTAGLSQAEESGESCTTAVKHLFRLQQELVNDIGMHRKFTFRQYAERFLSVNVNDLTSTNLAHFIAIVLHSWSKLTDTPHESHLVLCDAVVVTALMSNPLLNAQSVTETIKQISDLIRVGELVFHKYSKQISFSSSKVSSLAKRMKELERFLIEFRRLMGLIDVACVLSQRRPGTSKMSWPSTEYVRYCPHWMLFQSSRLVFTLVELLEQHPPEQHVQYITESWIPMFLSTKPELEDVKMQFVWVHDYLTKSTSTKDQLIQPD